MTQLSADEKARYVRDIFDRIAPHYDLMNRLMTGGQDLRWRREVIRRAGLHPHAALLDLGAGTGDLAREALSRQPSARIVAADFTLAMMRAGQRPAEPFAWSADTTAALTRMGYHVVPLEVWGAGNAAQAVGVAPADAKIAKTLGFPRAGVLYGASDAREPAGAAAIP